MGQSENNCQEQHILQFKERFEKAFLLEAAAYSIGRDETNAIVLNSSSISRQHAILLRVPGGEKQQRYIYRLVDGDIKGQASKNGTFVNGKPCSSQSIQDGDLISFGKEIQATYTVLLNDGSESVSDPLKSLQFHSLKVKLSKGKETVVSGVLDFNEIDKLNRQADHHSKPSPFQIFKKGVLGILQQKLF